MAGIQRFVTYIYAYENNVKKQNTGFARVDIRGDYFQIEIHLKRTGYTNMKCPVYLFTRDNEKLIGLEAGQILLNNGTGDLVRRAQNTPIGNSPYTISDVKGIIIFLNDQVMFGTGWDNGEIRKDYFSVYGKTEEKQSIQPVNETKKPEPALQKKEEQIENSSDEEQSIKKMDSTEQMQEDKNQAKQLHTDENTIENNNQDEAIHIQEMKETLAQAWEYFLKKQEATSVFEKNPEISCFRIDLKEIKMFPRPYWYLGNNSFLLHGFFNYHYILFGHMEVENKNRWFIGVPGVFQNQEKILAAIFGFPEFWQEKNTEIKTNQFGFWCRFMDE